ncbi:TetR/AcrR family transcriptional regulator [Variovorax sp. KK3]|uniref:TetR/AcrR family transcriptional regulator n=1 Tax=Variovorax sp. KK3 TaxID=1855728 RepID=UPI00097C4515|nr:TetR/AcrR family transcriptional regulator [Variovorax sp. KK3]
MAKRQANVTADTREKLLTLAARSFSTQGYTATTMRGIADQAGIEAASIYYHFASKEELVDEVMAHGADSIVAHLQSHLDALPAGAGARERFKAALVGQMSALIKFGDYAMAHGRLLAQLPDKPRERQVKRREHHQKLWTSLIEALRDEGLLRPDVDIALCRVFVLGIVNSAQTWFNPRKGSMERVAEQFCTIFFEGMLPEDRRPGVGGATTSIADEANAADAAPAS